MKIIRLFVFIFLSAGLLGNNLYSETEKDNAKLIMQKSSEMMKLSGLESISSLIISDGKGNQRIRKFSSVSKKFESAGVKKTLMKFLEPADVKGTGFLTYEYDNISKDNDMWMYMPALRKVRRIVSNEKSKSFMGSEFNNSDISSPKLDEYTYTALGEEKIGDIDCWKIQSMPISAKVADEYGFSKKISWISKTDYICRKMENYNVEGQLYKIITTSKVRELDKEKGLYQAVDISVENIFKNRKSQFLIEKSVLHPDVRESVFTTENLQK